MYVVNKILDLTFFLFFNFFFKFWFEKIFLSILKIRGCLTINL